MCPTVHIWDNWPQPPKWDEVRKHSPPGGNVDWDRVIKSTKGRYQARYQRGVPRRELETRCLEQGIQDPDAFLCHNIGNERLAMFWMDCGYEVGASDEEMTRYIVVRYQLQGTETAYHGYPATERELREIYGAKI